MTEDHEALHNRIKQNQAYNDHIVNQQNSIVKQFDKVTLLDGIVRALQAHCLVLDKWQLTSDQEKEKNVEVIRNLEEKVEKLSYQIINLKEEVADTRSKLEAHLPVMYLSLNSLSNELKSFKEKYKSDFRDILSAVENNNIDQCEKIDFSFRELNKQIPETPPYIQDLKDKIDHKLRVFGLLSSQALDKANHAEMLYKVIEKRTRS